MFIARQSGHIQQDITRNWSSWNFGQDGFEGTYDELQAAISEVNENTCFMISGFEFYGDDAKNADIRELYENYWVVVDNEHSKGKGIFGIELDAAGLTEAIAEAESRSDYFGDGVRFDAQDAKLVYSNNDIHIFEVE